MNDGAFGSAITVAAPKDADSASGDDPVLMRKILGVLLEIKRDQSEIKESIAEVQADIRAINETRDLEAKAMQEWRPQVSNDVKDIQEKVSVAENR